MADGKDEQAVKDKNDLSKTVISEDEAALYDRQIRLWGLDAQKRLRSSRVLLVGLNGLGAEICKNIVLCGVKSLTLLDEKKVTEQDFAAQFLIPRSDLGKNRADACLARAQRLNPMVDITSDSEPVTNKPKEFFKSFDVVILTGCSRNVMVQVNQICHEAKIKFYAGDVFGYFGYSFGDLVDHKYVEEQKTSSGISLVVNMVSNTTEGPPQKKFKKEEHATVMVKKFLEFCPLKDALNMSWAKTQTLKSLKKYSQVFFILQVMLKFQEKHDRNPQGSTSVEDIEEILKLRDDVLDSPELKSLLNDDFARQCIGVLSPTSSIVGGILAQDVIKALSGKDAPLNNFFFFDGQTGEGIVECFNGKS